MIAPLIEIRVYLCLVNQQDLWLKGHVFPLDIGIGWRQRLTVVLPEVMVQVRLVVIACHDTFLPVLMYMLATGLCQRQIVFRPSAVQTSHIVMVVCLVGRNIGLRLLVALIRIAPFGLVVIAWV